MYIPDPFAIKDSVTLRRFIEQNPFATLVSSGPAGLLASHLPILVEDRDSEPRRLFGHLARANPQSHDVASGSELLLLFHGAHAYISPFWYETTEAVPTWNYAAVHVYGHARIVHELAQSWQIVHGLTLRFERERAEELESRWSPSYREKMLRGIVAFEFQVLRIEGKFKLGQNRSPADVAGTYEALRKAADPQARALARLMEQQGLAKCDGL